MVPPARMKAVLCSRLDGPDALELVELDTPRPERGQVLVRLRAASLNFPDLLMTRGQYQFKPELPFIPGVEAAGEVVAWGEGIDGETAARMGVSQGARVIVGRKTGCFAQFIAVTPEETEAAPAGWDDAEASAARVGFVTAYHALVHRAALKPREVVLVHGATGGVGMAAVALAKALGAQVIATGGDDAKLEVVRAQGADFAINIRANPQFHELVKGLTDGRGANVIFDPIGGEVLSQSLRAAAWGARLLIIGFVSGGPTMIPSNIALIKGLSVLGVRAGEAARHHRPYFAEYRREMQRLAAAGQYRPHISHRLKLDQAIEAMHLMERRAIIGKAVLTID